MAYEGTNAVMPVAPVYGNNNSFGDSWAWIIILLLAFGGGFNNNNNNNNMWPWLNNADQMAAGFANQSLNSTLGNIATGTTGGFADIQTALCGGFAGVNATVNNGFAQAEIAENGRQTANMQQMFGIQSALQQCCCDNRAATADLKYTIANEAAASRANATANTQLILDKLCQQEIDAKNDRIAELERQLSFANLTASQTAQTASIIDALRTTTTAAAGA